MGKTKKETIEQSRVRKGSPMEGVESIVVNTVHQLLRVVFSRYFKMSTVMFAMI